LLDCKLFNERAKFLNIPVSIDVPITIREFAAEDALTAVEVVLGGTGAPKAREETAKLGSTAIKSLRDIFMDAPTGEQNDLSANKVETNLLF
jgi:hypothetical protein